MSDVSASSPTSRPIADQPESIGRYRIIRPLGEGGMGSVFLALDTVLHREVALKLPLNGTENDPEVRERFLREARSAATLDHPYICRVYDADFVEGRLYMAMAYIEGKSLADLVRAEGIPPRQVVALVGKLAIAMNEAHLKGVVHRDLKPRNVMIRTIGSKREPVIVDFGLARLEILEDARMTKTGQILGTPAYMSPEQLRGKPGEIGPACDIYSLGVIFYELLTGQLPFSGNYAVMVAQILTQPPSPPSAHRQGLDPTLDAICLKAMAKDVSERYASMSELTSALTGYLRTSPRISVSGQATTPVKRRIEKESIATGADTLVANLLDKDEGPDSGDFLQIDLSPAPGMAELLTDQSSRTGATSPISAINSWVSRLRWPVLASSAGFGLIVLVGIILFALSEGDVSTGQTKRSAGPSNSRPTVPFKAASGSIPEPNPPKVGDIEEVGGVEVKVGDPQFTLLWDSLADLDLHVVEPGGKEIFWNDPKGKRGGELDVDNVEGYGPENIYWMKQNQDGTKELGPGPSGEYKWWVNYYGGNNGVPVPTSWKVRIRHEGRVEVFEGKLTGPSARSGTYSLTVGTPDFGNDKMGGFQE